jgi:hypothetical protein
MRIVEHNPGAIRTRGKLLLLPKKIGKETRFFEYAIWAERLSPDRTWVPYEWRHWYKIKFRDIAAMKNVHNVNVIEDKEA